MFIREERDSAVRFDGNTRVFFRQRDGGIRKQQRFLLCFAQVLELVFQSGCSRAVSTAPSGFHAHGAVHGGVFCAAGQLTAMLGKAAGGIGCDACIERVVFTAQ